jgi:O-antigen/teichoic acid export membrane protein
MTQNTGRLMILGGAARTLGLVAHMAVGFLMMPFLVGELGNYWYGVYTASTGLISNFYLMDLGFTAATTREIAASLSVGDDESVNRTVNTALRIYTALGAAIVLCTLGLVALAPIVIQGEANISIVRLILFLTGLNLALSFPVKAFAGIVHSKLRYDLLVVIQLLTLALSVTATVWLLLHGFGVVAVAVVSLASGQFNNVLFALLAKYLFPPLRIRSEGFDRARGRELASYSVWSFVIQLAGQLRFRIDSLSVGWLFGGEAVTRYAIGARLIEYAQSPLVQISNTAMPVLTRLHISQQRERTADIVLFLLRLNLLLAVYAGGMVILLGRAFITRWMGPNYASSHAIAVVLAFALLTEVFLLPLTNWLYAAARHRMLAIANITEAVVNVALSLILGKLLGPIGVALGTAVPLILVQLLWVTPFACRGLGLSLGRFASLGLAGSIAVGVLVLAGSVVRGVANANGYIGIMAAGAAITMVYWPAVLFLCLRRDDRNTIWRALPLPAMARG